MAKAVRDHNRIRSMLQGRLSGQRPHWHSQRYVSYNCYYVVWSAVAFRLGRVVGSASYAPSYKLRLPRPACVRNAIRTRSTRLDRKLVWKPWGVRQIGRISFLNKIRTPDRCHGLVYTYALF